MKTKDLHPTDMPMAHQNLSSMPATKLSLPAKDRALVVDQNTQIMYIYENGVEVRQIPVSTGAPVSDRFTPAWQGTVGDNWGGGSIGREGFFTDYMWYLFAGPEGSILIHSLPYKQIGGEKTYDQPRLWAWRLPLTAASEFRLKTRLG